MCTAITYKTRDHYFGRNLDLELSYGEEIVITPRNYPINFLHEQEKKKHLAIIGMGIIVDKYPLYFDATNEAGLSMAGLNFPGNAYYEEFSIGKKNIASFELKTRYCSAHSRWNVVFAIKFRYFSATA